MRIVGPAVLGAFPGRILNTHPSLLPAFPGAHAVADALAHGVKVTGCTVHLVDATLDGGPILLQEAVPMVPGDDAERLHGRIRAVEHRLLPWAVALLYSGAVGAEGRRVAVATERAEEQVQFPRRALLAVSDKFGLVPFAERLVRAGFELVSTGGTARVLREAGLPVTDVAAVTGVAEMLDGRVKTLHPRIHAGVLADQTSHDHRAQLVAASIAPFELVVVNLYPFAAAAERPGITLPELIEEIDIGGPALIRAAAKNHRGGVAVVTSPARYDEVAASVEGPGGVEPVLAGRAGGGRIPPHRRLRRADRDRVAGPDPRGRWQARARDGPPGQRGPLPREPDDRAREGRDAALRRESAPTRGPRTGARGAPPSTVPSRPASRRSRARDSRTTTSSMPPRRRRSAGRCGARRASSSNTPTRAARPSGLPSSRRGKRRWRATPSRRSVAWWR